MILEALIGLITPLNILLMIGGSVLGIIFGAIPGLSGSTGIILLLPLTYRMDSITAIAFLISIWVGGCSGSCIGSIMLGIPGSSSSIATVYDGYEMTKKGEVVRALSAAVVSNFIGTLPSILIAMFASRVIAKYAVAMGPWEYAALGLCAITLVITLSKGNLMKGFIAMGLGLLIGCVGSAPVDGAGRFTFGNMYLLGGFKLVYVSMGVFAAKTILLEYARRKPDEKRADITVGGFRWPGRDLKENWITVVRSWLIGLWVGFLPGMGAALSNVTAYAMAKNASKHPEKFGTGTVEGVLAPEVANNASIGGAIIPMVSLGIPGDTATAYLLGALMIHGVEAGPLMFKNHPQLTYTIFLAGLIGAIFVLLFEAAGLRIFPLILKTPYHFLYPAIILVCFVGAYSNGNTMFNCLMMLFFTVIGILMAWGNIPTAPFILAFVLGDIIEQNVRKALSYANNGVFSFFTRPVSCVLMLIMMGCVVSAVWNIVKDRRKEVAGS